MDITQKNVLGDNIVNVGRQDRKVTVDLIQELVRHLREMRAKGVAIRNQDDAETNEFAEAIGVHLRANGYDVRVNSVGQSGIPRNQLALAPPTENSNTWAYLTIGSQ